MEVLALFGNAVRNPAEAAHQRVGLSESTNTSPLRVYQAVYPAVGAPARINKSINDE